ncbi:hypothetical protein [Nitrosomonas mobilis]|uniref:hypothetical protein n=1 Tax=Nitrosomonas mobilis TaxID=51642 RepID=UPI000B7D47E3|nr:hypothetical protein [Nitrosomonas mobilis]
METIRNNSAIDGRHAGNESGIESDSARWINRQFTVERDNKRPLAFKGELLASARSCITYGRWQELRLYRTIGGQYICQRSCLTQWESEPDSREAEVCRSVSEVMGFFEHSRLAKDLYASAGINTACLVY